MIIKKSGISKHNQPLLKEHQRKLDFISEDIKEAG